MSQKSFQQSVRNFYQDRGRDFPWRRTEVPYEIFISEIMLQQTQASRVVPKYNTWIERWPTFTALESSSRKEVLQEWQGLGYNRRATYLHEAAQRVVRKHEGRLPNEASKLKDLPGVGSYTAGALRAFCFFEPVVFVETNIRTVFIHHFFPNQDEITDQAIKQKVQDTLPSTDIREWYWGLMDYGNHLKQTVGNPNNRSKVYQTQSEFSGSNRKLRSQILRYILNQGPVPLHKIKEDITAQTERQKSVEDNLEDLCDEGMIAKTSSDTYHAPD